MSLNDKQQPLPTKVVGAYVITKIAFLFRNPLASPHQGSGKSKSASPSPSKRNSKLMSQGANLTAVLSAHGSQIYNQWVQRLKQICNDVNWEVRE